jgi:OmpA-OmpF porin, OOP family
MIRLLTIAIFTLSLTLSSFAQFTQTVVSLTGTTIDDLTKKPAKVQIKVFDMSGKQVGRTRSSGKYFLTGLKPGNTYSLEVYGKGYFFKEYEIKVPPTDKYAEISRDFVLTPMEEGAKIPMSVIPFDKGKTNIRTGADYVMDDIVGIMRSNRKASFEIMVYPEISKSPAEGLALSTARAESIKKYLNARKIRNEITLAPKGEYDPDNPLPTKKRAKGKRYKGSVYIIVKELL